ncbi:MAG: STAS domain-containing protein [Chloroflexaceae bacterium]|nr:STAS domain-containing protein [Chloroflexaceae bacterium]
MNPTVRILEPSGILDGTQSPDFRQEIEACIGDRVRIILIDLKKVTFMDSSGLGALVQALQTTRNANVKLHLCSLNPQLRMLFELTGLDDIFPIYPDRAKFERQVLEAPLPGDKDWSKG